MIFDRKTVNPIAFRLFERIWEANALYAIDSRLLRLSRSCGCLTRCMNAPSPFAVPDFAKQPLFKKNRDATGTGKKRRLNLSTP